VSGQGTGPGPGPAPSGDRPAVEVEAVADHVTAIRLNRPDRLNAISFDLVGELHDALDAVAADDGCKVAILTGAGRAFCAGLDLKDWGTVPAPGTHRHFPAGQTGQSFLANLMQHIRATPQIVLAVVNGPAYGGGLSLALACDLRICGASASFCSAFIRTGLTGTDAGVSYLLPRLIGAARAFDMIVTGRTVEAAEAERMGIVSRLVADGDLWDEAVALAATVAGYTTVGLRNTKEVMWHNLDTNSMAAAIALENRNQDLAGRSEEVREYLQAYAAPRRRDAGG
jgi:enoyl-CoA hydratase